MLDEKSPRYRFESVASEKERERERFHDQQRGKERIKIRERKFQRGKLVERNAALERSSSLRVSSHDLLHGFLSPLCSTKFLLQGGFSLVSAYLPRLYAVRKLKLGKERCLLECFPSAGQCMLINLLDQFKSQDGVCGLLPCYFSSLSLSFYLSLVSFRLAPRDLSRRAIY